MAARVWRGYKCRQPPSLSTDGLTLRIGYCEAHCEGSGGSAAVPRGARVGAQRRQMVVPRKSLGSLAAVEETVM